MSRYKEGPPAIRVYTACYESRYLIACNVSALGCGDELMRLFNTYREVEECKLMDAEYCEEFTYVYWIKFRLISNARFAKRKLDESVFMGNRLRISYAPEFESLGDTKDKLETRRKEVLARLNRSKKKSSPRLISSDNSDYIFISLYMNSPESQESLPSHKYGWTGFEPNRHVAAQSLQREMEYQFYRRNAPITRVSSDQEYFASSSMNQTVQTVRKKLNKIQENGNQKRLQPSNHNLQTDSDIKRTRVGNQRRI